MCETERKMLMKKWLAMVLVAVMLVPSSGLASGLDWLGGLTSLFSAEGKEYKLGETAEVDGLEIVLTNVMESKGNSSNKPGKGNVFLLLEFKMKNTTKETAFISSLMCFSMFCDGRSTDLSTSALAVGMMNGKYQWDRAINAGKTETGIVAYEVPADWKEVKVTCTPELFGEGATFWVEK